MLVPAFGHAVSSYQPEERPYPYLVAPKAGFYANLPAYKPTVDTGGP